MKAPFVKTQRLRNAPIRPGCQVSIIYAVTHGHLDDVEVAKIKEWENSFYELLEDRYSDLLDRFENGFYDDSDVERLEAAIAEMKKR